MTVTDVHDLVAQAAEQWPDHTAIIDDAGAMTFAELKAEVDALREALKAAGVGPRQGLGVIARNGRGFIAAVFAGLGCGATIMPISHQLKRAELDKLMAEAPLHALLDDRSGVEPLPARSRDVGHGAWRLAATDADPAHPFVPHVDDAAFVRFTSGTTGQSKGVCIGHASVLRRTEAAREALSLTPDDTVVWVLPMAWHFIVSIVMYVRYGVTIAVCHDLLASSVLDTAASSGGTVLYASPMHYRMLSADRSDRDLSGLRLAISTSSGIPRDVADRFQDRFGIPITQVYGIIEIGLPAGNLERADERPDAIGRPMPHHEVGILDDDGHPVTPGQIGHLAMKGPGMFDAYLNPPRTRDEVLVDGWFMTGDLAREEDGLIVVAGRKKSMINAAGLKVFPEEVEAVLNAHDDVHLSRVYGEPHPIMGEVVVADVQPEPGHALDGDVVRRWVRERLSTYKVPQRIRVVAEIPKTKSGKVVRHG